MPACASGAPSPNSKRSASAVEIWLRSEHLPPSERLDRLLGDADLVDSLREQGFAGDDWDFVVNELAKYGIAVIGGWMRRGVMSAKCAEKRIRVSTLPDAVKNDYEAVEEIAYETVAEAINHFRDDVLVPGVWDPAKGAALKTFFVGQCMKRYANVARRWVDHDQWPKREVRTDDHLVLDTGRVTGVDDDAIRHVTAQRMLAGVKTERAARALALDACGYTNADIAADLGTSLNGASSLIKRARADIRKTLNITRKGSA